MKQLGNEIFQVENGEVTLNVDRDSVYRIWEYYYVPMIKGYFGAYGSFRSDDVKTGDLLAYTGSTTSAMYFPDEVEMDTGRYGIEYIVMAAPVFEGGEQYAVQQGAGMVVSKSDERHEYASVEFLKWFTQAENNLTFCGNAGYLPVLKDANNTEILDKVIADQQIEMSDKVYDCLVLVFDEMDDVTLYTNKSFRNGANARKVLEYNLSDKAAADRAEVEKRLEQGMTLAQAVEPYLTDEAFEEWYQNFCKALQDTVN
jgi:multiple sugar transport system substrate-binding protein